MRCGNPWLFIVVTLSALCACPCTLSLFPLHLPELWSKSTKRREDLLQLWVKPASWPLAAPFRIPKSQAKDPRSYQVWSPTQFYSVSFSWINVKVFFLTSTQLRFVSVVLTGLETSEPSPTHPNRITSVVPAVLVKMSLWSNIWGEVVGPWRALCQLMKAFKGPRQLNCWKERKRTKPSLMRGHWLALLANQFFYKANF